MTCNVEIPVLGGDAPVDLPSLEPSRLFDLSGRVVLVTGAAGAVGSCVATGLVAAGAAVVLADLPSDRLDSLAESLRACGATALAFGADLSTEGSVDELVHRSVEVDGHLDAVVNCAATNLREPQIDVSPETFDRLIAIDLRMPFLLTSAAARVMMAAGRGSIVHVTSTNARFGLQSTSVYAVAKAGLEQLVRTTAVEFAASGVRVNAVAPGFLLTPLSQPLWADEDKRTWMLDRIPMRRPGTPDELVAAFIYLCSDASSFVTGQSLVVDGGFLAGNDWSRRGDLA